MDNKQQMYAWETMSIVQVIIGQEDMHDVF